MSNRLKDETSPYLLQHAKHPIDWYPWCDEAFEKAQEQDKPIFLSIGYSTCHWCHVMAHESFENQETADILNRHYICIKVDREARPDIDSVYMSVCQAFTGNGGWPMSIFMTPDKKPFFAGTYFPPHTAYGMPGFPELLVAIASRWNTNRKELLQSADQIIARLKEADSCKKTIRTDNLIETAAQIFCESFDPIYGGFGSAPKFPTPHNLLFLMLCAKVHGDMTLQRIAEKTLTQMRKGGIFDHIGYGFSRYSTDAYFLAPHFEKMLYDNALLIIAYCAAYQATQNLFYLDTAEKTAAYILRELTAENGGFYSAQDADSNGMEGKFYTFTLSEILSVLGKEKGTQFSQAFDITENGNFEGVNIPNRLKNNQLQSSLEEERLALYRYRKDRAALFLDCKILTAWNAMTISALCMLFRVSRKEQYQNAAIAAQVYADAHLRSGLQLFSWSCGEKRADRAFLDDYAYYTAALIEQYLSTLNTEYLKNAEQICAEAVKRFADNENGGYFMCEASANELFMNPKETYDGAVPSGNSVMAYNFVRLYQLTEKSLYGELAANQLNFLSAEAQSNPSGYSLFLTAKLLFENPPKHITIVLKEKADLVPIRKKLPFLATVSVVKESKRYPLINQKTTFYVCENHACLPPTNDINCMEG